MERKRASPMFEVGRAISQVLTRSWMPYLDSTHVPLTLTSSSTLKFARAPVIVNDCRFRVTASRMAKALSGLTKRTRVMRAVV